VKHLKVILAKKKSQAAYEPFSLEEDRRFEGECHKGIARSPREGGGFLPIPLSRANHEELPFEKKKKRNLGRKAQKVLISHVGIA